MQGDAHVALSLATDKKNTIFQPVIIKVAHMLFTHFLLLLLLLQVLSAPSSSSNRDIITRNQLLAGWLFVAPSEWNGSTQHAAAATSFCCCCCYRPNDRPYTERRLSARTWSRWGPGLAHKHPTSASASSSVVPACPPVCHMERQHSVAVGHLFLRFLNSQPADGLK